MAYTTEPARFAEQIAGARTVAGERPVWAGIGAYRLSPRETIDNIQTARRLGAAGVILFSYDSLIDPRQASPDYLPLVGRGAFAAPAGPRCRIALSPDTAETDGPHLARLPRHRRLPAGDHGVRILVRAVPEDHPRLLPDRPLGAVVGDLLHHRRHRDEHAELHRRARPARMPAT